MALQLLTRTLLVLLALTSGNISASSALDCRDVKVQNLGLKVSEETTLCFLRDDSYFISESCSNMDCAFIKRLRALKVEHSENERPGATMCKALGGIKEEINLASAKHSINRCLFTKEKVSISLNLLESWNGKHFTGPSKAIDL